MANTAVRSDQKVANEGNNIALASKRVSILNERERKPAVLHRLRWNLSMVAFLLPTGRRNNPSSALSCNLQVSVTVSSCGLLAMAFH